MINLTEIQQRVYGILVVHPETRNDNNLLIWAVHRQYGIDNNATYADVILKIRAKKLPAFESITRARRKVVELYPELDANAAVKALRKQQEKEYEEYARI